MQPTCPVSATRAWSHPSSYRAETSTGRVLRIYAWPRSRRRNAVPCLLGLTNSRQVRIALHCLPARPQCHPGAGHQRQPVSRSLPGTSDGMHDRWAGAMRIRIFRIFSEPSSAYPGQRPCGSARRDDSDTSSVRGSRTPVVIPWPPRVALLAQQATASRCPRRSTDPCNPVLVANSRRDRSQAARYFAGIFSST